jgi:hypothetical protein
MTAGEGPVATAGEEADSGRDIVAVSSAGNKNAAQNARLAERTANDRHRKRATRCVPRRPRCVDTFVMASLCGPLRQPVNGDDSLSAAHLSALHYRDISGLDATCGAPATHPQLESFCGAGDTESVNTSLTCAASLVAGKRYLVLFLYT